MKRGKRDQQARIRSLFEAQGGPFSAAQVTERTGVVNPHMSLKRLSEQGFLMRAGRNAYIRADGKSLLDAHDSSDQPINTTTLAYMRQAIVFIVGAIAVIANLLRHAGAQIPDTARTDAEQFIVEAMAFVGSPGHIGATLPGYEDVRKRFAAYVTEGSM